MATRIEIVQGDCLHVLREFPDDCIDLIVTSPPYADQRKHTYGGVAPDDYVAWFLPITRELRRVLKPTGTFILNIKARRFHMYQEEVMVPMGDWAQTRLKNLSSTDRVRDESRVGSGFGKKIENWLARSMAFPTNVLNLATECANRKHSAVFPEALPEWFIKLFTQEGDTVLDPFMGSGTTLRVAKRKGRNAVGIEIQPEYVEAVRNELASTGSTGQACRIQLGKTPAAMPYRR